MEFLGKRPSNKSVRTGDRFSVCTIDAIPYHIRIELQLSTSNHTSQSQLYSVYIAPSPLNHPTSALPSRPHPCSQTLKGSSMYHDAALLLRMFFP